MPNLMAKSSSSTFLALAVAVLLMSQALPAAHCARSDGSPTMRALLTAMKAKGGRFGAASQQCAPVLSDDSWTTNPGPSPSKGQPGSNRHE
ncbi:unnamed protein product [Urochloa decumbens]|uniref:Uncharacterized protein n=1 Tax=Urochloa decumbens TaxID=240449 RepID=A0ABC8YU28_9POAL